MSKVIYTMPIIGSHRTGPVRQPGPMTDVHVGNKYGQMGPTCWYYTAKLILKFHEMVTDKSDETYRKLKALQEIRNLLIEGTVQQDLDQQALKYLNAMAGAQSTSPFDSVDAKFNSSLAKKFVIAQLKVKLALLERDATQGRARPQTLIAKERQFGGAPRKNGASTGDRRKALETAIDLIRNISSDVPNRVELLNAFFGDRLTVIKADNWQLDTPEGLFKVLDTWGPFYAGGELCTIEGAKNTAEVQTNGTLTKGSVTVKAYGSSKHAIVIHGVDTKTKRVYYTDPNYTCYSYDVDFDLIKDQIKPKQTSDGDVFVTANCPAWGPNLDQWDGLCTHMRNKRTYEA
jgi:hypothetical protein